MAFLVKDLVDRQIFGGVRLVAGVLNVSNPILWVNVMEILDTPRSLNEGELVVSTGYGLEDQSLHKDLIHQLKKRGVSGLAIQPGYYIDQIPEYIIEDANKEGLPALTFTPIPIGTFPLFSYYFTSFITCCYIIS